MMPLHQLQKRFVASLVLDISDPVLFRYFLPENKRQQNFAVYRDNRRGSLFKTLKNVYPVCCCLLGESCFRALSYAFIQQEISSHFSLNAFGKSFSEFIKTYGQQWGLPYLSDMAKLEWVIHEIFNSASNSAFSFQTLAATSDTQHSEIRLTLAETGRLFSADFPVDHIWLAHYNAWEKAGDLDLSSNIAQDIEPMSLPQGGIQRFISRNDQKNDEIQFQALSELEWELLWNIHQGKTLAELYQEVNKMKAELRLQVLTGCLKKGYITGIKKAKAFLPLNCL